MKMLPKRSLPFILKSYCSEHQLAIATAMRQKVRTCDACGKLG